MYTRRLAAIAGISIVLAACTTTPRSTIDTGDGAETPPSTQIAVAKQAPAEKPDEVPAAETAVDEPEIETSAGTSVESSTTTQPPPTTTTTTAEAQSGTAPTTTSTVPQAEDITALMKDLDALLSSLGGQIDGLDADLAEVDASLSANEGDIGQ